MRFPLLNVCRGQTKKQTKERTPDKKIQEKRRKTTTKHETRSKQNTEPPIYSYFGFSWGKLPCAVGVQQALPVTT